MECEQKNDIRCSNEQVIEEREMKSAVEKRARQGSAILDRGRVCKEKKKEEKREVDEMRCHGDVQRREGAKAKRKEATREQRRGSFFWLSVCFVPLFGLFVLRALPLVLSLWLR